MLFAATPCGCRPLLARAAPLAVRRWQAMPPQHFGKQLNATPAAEARGASRGALCSRGSSSSSSVATAPASDSPESLAAATHTAASAAGNSYDPPHFSDLPLDRSGGLRRQDQELQRLLAEPSTRVLLLHRGRLLVAPAAEASNGSRLGPPELPLRAHSFTRLGAEAPDGGPPRWVPLTASPQQLQLQAASASGGCSAAGSAPAPPDLLFLGLEGSGAAVFACQVPAHLLPLLPPTEDSAAEATGGPAFVEVRGEGQRMAGQDAAVAALAAGLVQWHASAAFCSRTGVPTVRRAPWQPGPAPEPCWLLCH